jgi:DNA/RNA endonuclease YhcR with UshA esterase domain
MKMNEKTLRNIAIICSLSGLTILFFISQNLDIERTNIGEISVDELGRVVKICGSMKDKFVSKKENIFFNLKDETGEIKVVIFKNTAKSIKKKFKIDPYTLNETRGGEEICVVGEVDEYKKEIEVKASRLIKNFEEEK